jgi:hypothetical protein
VAVRLEARTGTSPVPTQTPFVDRAGVRPPPEMRESFIKKIPPPKAGGFSWLFCQHLRDHSLSQKDHLLNIREIASYDTIEVYST